MTDYVAARDPSLSILTPISHPDLTVKKALLSRNADWRYSEGFLLTCCTNGAIVDPVLEDASRVDFLHEEGRIKCRCHAQSFCFVSFLLSPIQIGLVLRRANIIIPKVSLGLSLGWKLSCQ